MGTGKCSDYWCEHYGKGNEKCNHCVQQENTNGKTELAVILKRRAVEQMELAKTYQKNRGQKR